MDKIGGFKIEFYKSIAHISESDKLTIDEQFEVGEQATFYVESLVYFMTTEISAFDVIDNDSYSIHLVNVRTVIDGFLGCVRESLNQLDKRRIEMEKIVAQIPIIK